MVNYDPAVIRSFADKLYVQASAAVRSQMILGALIGIVGGLWAGGSLFEYKNAIGSFAGAILAASVGTLVGLMSAGKGRSSSECRPRQPSASLKLRNTLAQRRRHDGCSPPRYDTASRLTSEAITSDPSGPAGNGALSYSIDPVGNRTTRTSTLAALGAQSFGYDANDELTTDSYDANGNTTTSGGHTYGYDFENRLVSKDGGTVTLVFDGDGNRVAKTAGGVSTKYLVDELNPTGYLQVMDEASGGTVQVRYTFGNMLVSQTRTPSTSPATSAAPWA